MVSITFDPFLIDYANSLIKIYAHPSIIFMAIGIILDAPLWVFGFTLFFLAFHYHDMKVMGWRGRLVRFLWVFTLGAAVTGIVWFFVPKEDWSPPPLLLTSLFFPIAGVSIGLILGFIEGISPDTIYPRWHRFVAWWKSLGGY